MAMIRKIKKEPSKPQKNFYVIDACFLANRFIPEDRAPNSQEKRRIRRCNEWWNEIERQLNSEVGRVFIPDICIAEAFKVLAKRYYKSKWFRSPQDFGYWRKKLQNMITTPINELTKANRRIRYHDVESNRDIIIAVDRFYELFFKHGKNVSLPDLIVVATAKYLIDFFDIPKSFLHIVTMDKALRDGSKKIHELPNAYDPTIEADGFARIFH